MSYLLNPYIYGSSWEKQKAIFVNSTPTSNFQVRIVLNSSNISYTDFNNDGSDIRFTSSLLENPEESFYYWIEDWNTSGNSIIWVKVPSQSTRTFYMFYKNLSASGISSIDDTMESGLRFRYYGATASFTNLIGGGTCGAPNTDWGSGTVSVCGVGSRSDNVTVMWDGWVIPTNTGNHTFFGTSDDGQRLYVNSSLILNQWVDRGPTENSSTVNMTDVLPKRIQYDWYENGGGAVAKLGWTPVGGSKTYPIPSTNLRSPKYDSSYNDTYSYTSIVSDIPIPVTDSLELYLDPSNSQSYSGSGTTLFDISTNARNGAIQGSPPYTDPYFTFNGNTQRIYTTYGGPNEMWAVNTQNWSACAWFRCPVSRTSNGTANHSNMILGRCGGIGGAAQFGLYVHTPTQNTYGTPNTLAIVLRGTNTQISPSTINDNEWHHVAATWDGTTCATYLDGEFQVNATVGTAVNQTGFDLSMGDNGNTSVATAHAWEGDLSQALVYSSALTASEVEQNFNATKSIFGL